MNIANAYDNAYGQEWSYAKSNAIRNAASNYVKASGSQTQSSYVPSTYINPLAQKLSFSAFEAYKNDQKNNPLNPEYFSANYGTNDRG